MFLTYVISLIIHFVDVLFRSNRFIPNIIDNHYYKLFRNTYTMKILKSFAHVLLVVVGASLLIYGLDKFDLIDPIVKNVDLGLKKIKSLL